MEQADNVTGKGRRKALWAAVAVVAVIAAGITGAKIVCEGKVNEFVARSGGKADSVKVDFLGRVHLRNVTLPLSDGATLRIATVDGRQSLLFLKGELAVSGLDAEMPLGKISVPQASVEDASFDNSTLKEIFSSDSAIPVSKRIERFAAKRISIPELNVTQSIAGNNQTTVYKNVSLDDIADGRIARYSVASLGFDIAMTVPAADGETKTERMTGSTGAVTGQDFDVAYATRLYTEKAGPEDTQSKLVYGPLSAKAITFSNHEIKASYDEMRSNGFSMRMPKEPLVETLKILATAGDPDDLPPAERQAMFTRVLSIFDMIDKGDTQFLGMSIDGTLTDGENAGKKVRFTIDRMAFQLDNRKVDMGLHGMSMVQDENTFKIAEASIAGFSWNNTIEALNRMVAMDDQQLETFQFSQLMPEIGTIRVAGVDVDVTSSRKDEATAEDGTEEQTDEPADEASVTVPERIRFSLKKYELALTRPYNGIPTDIRISQEDLSIPILPEMMDEVSVQLRKLGIEQLVISYNISTTWDEAARKLLVRDISFSGKDMGSISLSGVVGGFTKDFFSYDPAKTQVALFGLTGQEAKLSIRDEGFIAKAIKFYASENNMTEDQVRGLISLMAPTMLQQFATDQPRLKGTVDALLRFIGAPGTLTLTARSIAQNGIGVFDLAAASQNPMLIFDKIDIEATAQ